jgi:hypothetical protein
MLVSLKDTGTLVNIPRCTMVSIHHTKLSENSREVKQCVLDSGNVLGPDKECEGGRSTMEK